VQGIADHEVRDSSGGAGAARGQEKAPVASIKDLPGVGVGEEGEGEVDELREGDGGRGGAVRRLGVVERPRGQGEGTFRREESNDGRAVEEPVAAEEAGDAEEGGAGGGGAGHVGRGGQVEEDFLKDLIGEGRERPQRLGVEYRRRRQGHGGGQSAAGARRGGIMGRSNRGDRWV